MLSASTNIDNGIQALLKQLGIQHKNYVDVLTLRTRLTKNIEDTTRLGENESRRTEWAQIVDALNRITLEATGQRFDELCDTTKARSDGSATVENITPVSTSQNPTHIVNLGRVNTMATTALPCCPFVAGPKITDPRLFVGRETELHRLINAMEGVQPISVNVVGERRIGKSSLLYHLFQTWEQRVRGPQHYVVAYLSLQDAAAQREQDFYRAIASALLARPIVQDSPALVTALNSHPLHRRQFSTAMRLFANQRALPVLCLDEFEALLKYPRQFDDGFYDALRALMDDNVVMLIVASLKPLDVYRRRRRLTSSFFNLGQMLALEELSGPEAADLVRLPASTVNGVQAALSLDEQRLALAWGKRNPCLLQLAASFLCEARQEGHGRAWAKAHYQAEARRIPHKKHWFQPLRRPLFTLPQRIGSLASGMGGTVDEVKNWIVGMVIIIVIVLALLGLLTQTQVIKLLRTAVGG